MKRYEFIKPREGLKVRDPITFDILPEKGMEVPFFGKQGTYYKRRVKCGDCIIVKNEPPESIKKKKVRE